MNKIDELKAEIAQVEKELENKRDELKVAESKEKDVQVGDYVECATCDGNILIGILIAKYHNGVGYKIETWKDEGIYAFKSIKKWQPKKGDLCIFWDYEKRESFIDIFKKQDGSLYSDRENCRFFNCIPFISEQQFKDHIGYE